MSRILIIGLIIFGSIKVFGNVHSHCENSFTISGYIKSAMPDDSLALLIWKPGLGSNFDDHRRFILHPKNGFFKITVDGVDNLSLCSLGRVKDAFNGIVYGIMYHAIIEKGDNVVIDVNERGETSDVADRYVMKFSGRGYEKYEYNDRMRRMISQSIFNQIKSIGDMYSNNQTEINIDVWDLLKKSSLSLLKDYSNKLSPDVLLLLRAQTIGIVEFRKVYGLTRNSPDLSTSSGQNLQKLYNDRFRNTEDPDVPIEILNLSFEYREYIIRKILYTDFYFNQSHRGRLLTAYDNLKAAYSGDFLDNLLTGFYEKIKFSADKRVVDTILNDMLMVVVNPRCIERIKMLSENTAVGSKAFDFRLPDENRIYHTLSQYEGKVVFMDFWYTGCHNCAAYYQHVLSKVEERYKDNKQVVFITVNIDNTREMWLSSLKRGGYTGSNSVNLHTDNQGVNSPIIRHYNISGYPFPLLIGKDGRIHQTGTILRDEDKLIANIEEALTHNSKN